MEVCEKHAREALKRYYEVMDYYRNGSAVDPKLSQYQRLENFEPFYNIISRRIKTEGQEHEHLILDSTPQKNKQLVFAGVGAGEDEGDLDRQIKHKLFCYQVLNK